MRNNVITFTPKAKLPEPPTDTFMEYVCACSGNTWRLQSDDYVCCADCGNHVSVVEVFPHLFSNKDQK